MKKNKRILAFLLALVICLTFSPIKGETLNTAFAKGNNSYEKVKIDSKYAVVIEANSGQVLYGKNETHKMYPASTSKVMTAIVALENGKPTDMLTVSENALKGQQDNGAHIGLKKGEKISLKDCLCALWIESANDAAITIAENIAGSEEEFAKLLNEKAKELNLENSHFVTPNGLYHKEHYTTPKDLAMITAYALKNPDFDELINTHKHELPPTNKRKDPVTIYTNHPMAPYKYNAYPYIIGGKTGYVPESKCNMITVAEKDGLRLISITGKTNSLYTAAEDAKILLDTGFNSYKKHIITRDKNNFTLKQTLENGNYATRKGYVRDGSISIVLPKGVPQTEISFKLNERELMFPITKGTEIGSVDAIYQNQVVGSSPILASKDMSFFLYAVYSIFKVILYVIPILLIIFILLVLRNKQRKKKRRKKLKGNRPYNPHGPNENRVKSSEVKAHKTKGNRTTKK